MAGEKSKSVVTGAALAILAFVVLYFGAPGIVAGFCAERTSGRAPSGVLWECLAR